MRKSDVGSGMSEVEIRHSELGIRGSMLATRYWLLATRVSGGRNMTNPERAGEPERVRVQAAAPEKGAAKDTPPARRALASASYNKSIPSLAAAALAAAMAGSAAALGGYSAYMLSISVLALLASAILYRAPDGAAGADMERIETSNMKLWRFKRNVVGGISSVLLAAMIILLSIVELFALLVRMKILQINWDIAYVVADLYTIILASFLIVGCAVIVLCTAFPQLKAKEDSPLFKRMKIGGAAATGFFTAFALVMRLGLLAPVFEPHHSVYILTAGIIAEMLVIHLYVGLPGLYSFLLRLEVGRKVEETEETMRRRMWAVYVLSMVFVVAFISIALATQLEVISLRNIVLRDVMFGVYVFGGIVLLAYLLRYYMRSGKKQEEMKRKRNPEELARAIIIWASIALGGVSGVIGIIMYFGAIKPISIAGNFAIESMDMLVAAILMGMGPYGFYHNMQVKRTSMMEAHFPDFLRDLAESKRAGMTLTQALLTTAKGKYGGLTDEIRKMAAQITWGVPFVDALHRFGERARTPLIQRSTSLIIEANNAGGNVVDTLEAAANDAREIKQIKVERRQSMSIYVIIIYLAFLVFLAIIEILYTQFIPEIHKAVSGVAGASVGGMTFVPFDVGVYKTLFFHSALIQGIGGGLVAGVMEEGKAAAGLRHVFIMVIIAYAAFRFLVI